MEGHRPKNKGLARRSVAGYEQAGELTVDGKAGGLFTPTKTG